MNGMVWLSTVRSSSHAARCKVSEERTPHATVCIVLRPTLAGAGDYKELRRIPLPKYNKDSRRVPKGPV